VHSYIRFSRTKRTARANTRRVHSAFSIMLLVGLSIVPARAALTQVASVTVVEIPAPSAFVADLRSRNEPMTDALLAAIPPRSHVFVVVATRGQAGWIGEITADASSMTRQRLAEESSNVLEESGRAPVVAPIHDALVGIQNRVREQTGGAVTFTEVRLGARDLISAPSLMSSIETLPASQPMAGAPAIPRPPPGRVRSLSIRIAFYVLILLATCVIGARWRNKRKLARSGQQVAADAADVLAQYGIPALSQDSLAPWDTLDLDAPIRRKRRQSSTGSFASRPPAKPFIEAVVAILMIALPQHDSFGQRVGVTAGDRPAQMRTAAVNMPLASHATASPQLSVQAYYTPTRRDSHASVDLYVDASGSIRNEAVSVARRIGASFLVDDRSVGLSVFGDSVVHVGTFEGVGRLDSALSAQPMQRRTRLGDAILSAIADQRGRRRGHVVIFVSDFVPDDAGNEVLRFLPSAAPPAPTDMSGATETRHPPLLSSRDELLSALAVLGIGVLAGTANGRREERRNRRAWLGEHVRISVRGRGGREVHDLPLGDFHDPRPLFGDQPDALVRTRVHEELPEMTLSTTLQDRGATIVLSQGSSKPIEQLTVGR